MKEIGLINRNMAKIIAEQGHHDLLMVVDAGFAIPAGVEVVDLSLRENQPRVLEVLGELEKYHSVEKIIVAKQTLDKNPTFCEKMSKVWEDVVVEFIDHEDLREIVKKVKAVIRTGDFTAYGNIVLVSGAGNRWSR